MFSLVFAGNVREGVWAYSQRKKRLINIETTISSSTIHSCDFHSLAMTNIRLNFLLSGVHTAFFVSLSETIVKLNKSHTGLVLKVLSHALQTNSCNMVVVEPYNLQM